MRKGAGAIAILFVSSVAQADDDGKVKVEVRGDADASLEQAIVATYPDIGWKPLCTTPCTIEVPGDATVRIAGAIPSIPLKLEQHDTILRAHVPPASTATAGNALIAFGSVILAYSAVSMLVGLGLEMSTFCIFCSRPVDHTVPDALIASSGVALVAGSTMLGIGFSLRGAGRARLNVSARGVSLKLAF